MSNTSKKICNVIINLSHKILTYRETFESGKYTNYAVWFEEIRTTDKGDLTERSEGNDRCVLVDKDKNTVRFDCEEKPDVLNVYFYIFGGEKVALIWKNDKKMKKELYLPKNTVRIIYPDDPEDPYIS